MLQKFCNVTYYGKKFVIPMVTHGNNWQAILKRAEGPRLM